MPSVESIYPDFLNAVGFASGKGADFSRWNVDELALMDRMVQWGYRGALYPTIAPGQRRAYRWNHLFPTATLELLTAVTGTLDRILDPIGSQYVLIANEEIFTAAMEGLIIEMDDSKMRYTITDYITESKVKMQGEAGTETEFGGIKKSKIVSAVIAGTMTLITDSNALFTADMVGDEHLNDATFDVYTIKRYVSATQVYVDGDASGEPGAAGQTIRTSAFTSVPTLSGTAQTVVADSPPPFTTNMVDDFTSSKRIGLTKATASAGAVIDSLTDSSTVVTDNQLDLTGSAIGDAFYISISSGGISYGSPLNVMTVVVEDPIFTADDVDRYLSVPGTSQRGLKILNYIDAYTVQGVIDTPNPENEFADGVGHVTYEPLKIEALLYNPTIRKTYVTVSSSTTIAATDVGRSIHSPATGRTYSITAYVDATHLWASGDMVTAEATDRPLDPPWNHWIVGPVTHAADDAFTILNTGGDYEMPADFPGTMDGYFTFAPQQSYTPIRIIGEGQIRKFRQGSTVARRPLYVAFVPIQSDNRKSQRFKAMFDSAPDQSYTLTYRYAVVPQKLTFDAPYPLGGPEFSELIMASCLAMVETHIEDVTGTMRRDEFRQKLAAAVTADEMAMTPEYLGYNANERRNLPGVSAAEWRRFSGVQVTIDEVQY